ncbi:MAG: hypothetical protein H7Y60_06955 [Rhodospirillaceae bacterium]|nr:hypothetical protein [Rhodospirillales bacterium]
MRLSRTALGLAAMGAGLLVARAMSSRRGGKQWQSSTPPEPPSPTQLIGSKESHLSASDAAEAFRASRDRPV